MSEPVRAVHGLKFPGPDGKPRRVAAGERCDDVPEDARDWLLEHGHIETIGGYIDDMNAPEAVKAIEDLEDLDELHAIEDREKARSKPRVTVMRAIAARRDS